jgi:hypothetical protein
VLDNELFLDYECAFDISKAYSIFTGTPKNASNFYEPSQAYINNRLLLFIANLLLKLLYYRFIKIVKRLPVIF